MSWLLKQAEDILNRVDQQTNAALHQQTPKIPNRQTEVEFTSEIPAHIASKPVEQSIVNPAPTHRLSITSTTRRTKKADESDLINYLNSSTPISNNEPKKSTRVNSKSRTSSSSSTITDDPPSVSSSQRDKPIPATTEEHSEKELIASLQAQIERLTYEKNQSDNELQTYKRQQIQYQHQIAESDALLRDLCSRESDSLEVLSTKDSQLAALRIRLTESDELLQSKYNQYDQLYHEYSRLVQDSTNIQSPSSDFLQSRVRQIEQELERNFNENERLSHENQQLIEQLKLTEKQFHDVHLQFYEQQQQTKQAKNSIQQSEHDMNEYKIKAQRILQTKDKLINKLKDILQQRSGTPTMEIESNDDSTLFDANSVGNLSSSSSNWASIQYEELQSENDLFKQELQARELTIHTLRNEAQEAELFLQQNDEQYQEQIAQLNEQLKEKNSRLILAEQDCRKMKQELLAINEDFNKQKQMYQGQITEREHDMERLRLQLTAKTINHVTDDELEKRLQTLTESLIHKQTIIETLQTEKSSLTMQLERLEKRLEDYEIIAANTRNSAQQSLRPSSPTSIPMDENEHYENLRYRVPLLRETPYDVDLTKKVKRAANHLDQLGVRLTIFLRRYPAVRIAVLFYVIVLHLWTFIVLFTHTPEIHSNTNSIDLKDKL